MYKELDKAIQKQAYDLYFSSNMLYTSGAIRCIMNV